MFDAPRHQPDPSLWQSLLVLVTAWPPLARPPAAAAAAAMLLLLLPCCPCRSCCCCCSTAAALRCSTSSLVCPPKAHLIWMAAGREPSGTGHTRSTSHPASLQPHKSKQNTERSQTRHLEARTWARAGSCQGRGHRGMR